VFHTTAAVTFRRAVNFGPIVSSEPDHRVVVVVQLAERLEDRSNTLIKLVQAGVKSSSADMYLPNQPVAVQALVSHFEQHCQHCRRCRVPECSLFNMSNGNIRWSRWDRSHHKH
jgi:hypothetical protein